MNIVVYDELRACTCLLELVVVTNRAHCVLIRHKEIELVFGAIIVADGTYSVAIAGPATLITELSMRARVC